MKINVRTLLNKLHAMSHYKWTFWTKIDISPKKTYREPRGTWKDTQHSWLLEKCKLKVQWVTSHQSEWLSSKCQQTINAGECVEKRETPKLLKVLLVECKLVQPLWRIVWSFLKKLKIEPQYDPAITLLGI